MYGKSTIIATCKQSTSSSSRLVSLVIRPNKEALCMAEARLKLKFLNIRTGITASLSIVIDTNMDLSSTYLSSSMSSTSDSTTTGYEINVAYNKPSEEATYYLCRIAKRMNSVGYVGECFQVECTKGFPRDQFEAIRDQLIRATTVCYSIFFSREKKLFSQIFDGTEGDQYFSETIKDAEIQLMNFAEALITSRISPDKLFKFFDLSKVLLNSWVLLECTNFSRAKGPEGTLVMRSYDKIGERDFVRF